MSHGGYTYARGTRSRRAGARRRRPRRVSYVYYGIRIVFYSVGSYTVTLTDASRRLCWEGEEVEKKRIFVQQVVGADQLQLQVQGRPSVWPGALGSVNNVPPACDWSDASSRVPDETVSPGDQQACSVGEVWCG